QHTRRQLIRERFAGSGGHDGDAVAARQHGVDDLPLSRPEGGEAEHGTEDRERIGGFRSGERKVLLMHGVGGGGLGQREPPASPPSGSTRKRKPRGGDSPMAARARRSGGPGAPRSAVEDNRRDRRNDRRGRPRAGWLIPAAPPSGRLAGRNPAA